MENNQLPYIVTVLAIVVFLAVVIFVPKHILVIPHLTTISTQTTTVTSLPTTVNTTTFYPTTTINFTEVSSPNLTAQAFVISKVGQTYFNAYIKSNETLIFDNGTVTTFFYYVPFQNKTILNLTVPSLIWVSVNKTNMVHLYSGPSQPYFINISEEKALNISKLSNVSFVDFGPYINVTDCIQQDNIYNDNFSDTCRTAMQEDTSGSPLVWTIANYTSMQNDTCFSSLYYYIDATTGNILNVSNDTSCI